MAPFSEVSLIQRQWHMSFVSVIIGFNFCNMQLSDFNNYIFAATIVNQDLLTSPYRVRSLSCETIVVKVDSTCKEDPPVTSACFSLVSLQQWVKTRYSSCDTLSVYKQALKAQFSLLNDGF
jgi:hypothetical protein